MFNECKYVSKTFELVRKMILLADKAEMGCTDYSSTVLFGIVRDCAYKIRARAEEERSRLKLIGEWKSKECVCSTPVKDGEK